MGKDNVVGFRGREADADPLTELLRVGARQLIHQAVEAELQELLAEHSERRTVDGKAGVVRNGYRFGGSLRTLVRMVTW
jgi:putative transposase